MSSLNELQGMVDDLKPCADLETKLRLSYEVLIKSRTLTEDINRYGDLANKYYMFCISLTYLDEHLELGFSSLISFLKIEALGSHMFPVERLYQVLDLLISHPKASHLAKLHGAACSRYSDIRYYTLKYMINSSELKMLFCLEFLESLEIFFIVENIKILYIQIKETKNKITDLKLHRTLFTKFIKHLLKPRENITMTDREHRKVLGFFDEEKMKFMTRPTLLADYFSESFNNGGLVGLLSLSGLFYLMRKHNLEYPSFYDKLYTLLTPELFAACRYRKRFLKLISTFMRSTHVSDSAYASILKKISKMSLGAPSHSLKWLIPFLYNGMKIKTKLRTMIHNSIQDNDWIDPFDPKKNVELSLAENSSLWELGALEKYHYAPISSSIKIFSDRLVRPPYDLNKSLDENVENSYSILKRELGFKWTKKPPTQLSFSRSIIN